MPYKGMLLIEELSWGERYGEGKEKSGIMIKILEPKIKTGRGADNVVNQKVKLSPGSKTKVLYLNKFLFLFIQSVCWGGI